MKDFKFTIVMVCIIAAILIFAICVSIANQSNVEIVTNCKVIDLQQQQLISGSDKHISTEIRYLVITDKETFVCESSILNGKYNNSDIFWHLKKDSTYNFKVAGIGKSMFTEYRNILDIIQSK